MGDTPIRTEYEEIYLPVYEEKPVKIMENVKYVSTGAYSSYVIKNDDTLWGFGWIGPLGDETKEHYTRGAVRAGAGGDLPEGACQLKCLGA